MVGGVVSGEVRFKAHFLAAPRRSDRIINKRRRALTPGESSRTKAGGQSSRAMYPLLPSQTTHTHTSLNLRAGLVPAVIIIIIEFAEATPVRGASPNRFSHTHTHTYSFPVRIDYRYFTHTHTRTGRIQRTFPGIFTGP